MTYHSSGGAVKPSKKNGMLLVKRVEHEQKFSKDIFQKRVCLSIKIVAYLMLSCLKQKVLIQTRNLCFVIRNLSIVKIIAMDLLTALNTRIIPDSGSGFATTVANATMKDWLKAKAYGWMKMKKKKKESG